VKITDAVHEFILYKQSLGMTYKNRALELTAFVPFSGPIEIHSISPETVRRFLDAGPPVTAEWFNKFFFRFALSRGYATRNPLPLSQPKNPRQFRPYIYSVEEVQKMIRVVDNRHRGNWHLEPYTIRTLILLLYGTGLRIGEAIRLQHRDVDLNDAILTVRQTKFCKTRLVPVGSDLTGVLRGYFERKWKEHGSSTSGTPSAVIGTRYAFFFHGLRFGRGQLSMFWRSRTYPPMLYGSSSRSSKKSAAAALQLATRGCRPYTPLHTLSGNAALST
jgi:integrase